MNRVLRIILNLLIFILVIGFAGYLVHSLVKDEPVFGSDSNDGMRTPYKKINSIKVKSEILSFDLSDNNIYMAVSHAVMVYNKTGKLLKEIPAGKEIRDIKVEGDRIYLLYPAGIEVFTLDGVRITGWEARRPNSDYCAMTPADEYIFVTDAGNKNICKYTKEGDFISIILSPNGFIIPSYAFDIVNIGDTIYCSNSGRHQIESYTINGEYIASFGKSGSEAGSFAGCCNPVYLECNNGIPAVANSNNGIPAVANSNNGIPAVANSNNGTVSERSRTIPAVANSCNPASPQHGDILTSEKGNPRISCYSRDGKFKAILLGSKMLGGGTKAYRMKVQGDKIFVIGKNVLSEFIFDPQLASQSACAGCPHSPFEGGQGGCIVVK